MFKGFGTRASEYLITPVTGTLRKPLDRFGRDLTGEVKDGFGSRGGLRTGYQAYDLLDQVNDLLLARASPVSAASPSSRSGEAGQCTWDRARARLHLYPYRNPLRIRAAKPKEILVGLKQGKLYNNYLFFWRVTGSGRFNRRPQAASDEVVRCDAGQCRYRVGIETPSIPATSRGGVPLARSFIAAASFSVVKSFGRPPIRPR